jgi:hypothetical protein
MRLSMDQKDQKPLDERVGDSAPIEIGIVPDNHS